MSVLAKKKQFGQFFTVNETVQNEMVSLLSKPWGKALEPSAGSGELMSALLKKDPKIDLVGFELDETIEKNSKDLNIEYGDFFLLANGSVGKFDSILGNPPFVAWKNVAPETMFAASSVAVNYSKKANLYHLFIDRCIDLLKDDGQLVMITPKEWLFSTSAAVLRQKILRKGRLTHLIDLGETKVFPDADVPALVIFRFQKTVSELPYQVMFKQWKDDVWKSKFLTVLGDSDVFYLSDEVGGESFSLGDFFTVRVGLVSGADSIFNITDSTDVETFKSEGATIDLFTTKGFATYIFVDDFVKFDQIPSKTRGYLLAHKETLLKRRISKFNEFNWWRWGAVRNIEAMRKSGNMIFVQSKTRQVKPFFLGDNRFFSGGMLMLDPKRNDLNLAECVNFFNSDRFKQSCYDMGLMSGNKLSFQPSTLMSCPVPDLKKL